MWCTISLYIIELVIVFSGSCFLLVPLFFFLAFLPLPAHFNGYLSSVLYVKVSFRKKEVSCESDLKDAVVVCLPLIHATVRDIEKGTFPKSFLLNIEIPSCPSTNKVCFLCCYVFGLCASIVIWADADGQWSMAEVKKYANFPWHISLSFNS